MRVVCVTLMVLLRILTYRTHLQAFLDQAYGSLCKLQRETGNIKIADLQLSVCMYMESMSSIFVQKSKYFHKSLGVLRKERSR